MNIIYIINIYYIYIYNAVYVYIGIALYYAYGPFGTFKFPSSKFFGAIQTRLRRIQELEEQNALLQRSFEGRVRSSKLRDKHRQQDVFFFLGDPICFMTHDFLCFLHIRNKLFEWLFILLCCVFGGPN